MLMTACGSPTDPEVSNDAPGIAIDRLDGKADSLQDSSIAVREIGYFNAHLDDVSRQSKYCRMSESPFVFFRGTNHLFWRLLADDPRLSEFGGEPATQTWIQGDLHVENFGAFDDDAGDVVYDLNDFDEAVVADYQYDVWRVATSIDLAATDAGFSRRRVRYAVDAFTESYLDAIADFRGNGKERTTRFTAESVRRPLRDFLEDVEDEGSRLSLLDEWTDVSYGERLLDLDNPELASADDAQQAIRDAWSSYGETLAGGLDFDADYFRVKDVARRLGAGTGSRGTPRFYVLIEGETASPDDDRILDVKRQGLPTPHIYADDALGRVADGDFPSEAARVVEAERAMLNNANDHLGWLELPDGSYSVRERSPFKKTFRFNKIDDRRTLYDNARSWGEVLGAAHARADRDADSGLVPHSLDREVDERTDGRHAEFRKLVREVSAEFAEQTRVDYAAFVDSLGADACQ
jgi:uncharacterized protein (DUF2252 family)